MSYGFKAKSYVLLLLTIVICTIFVIHNSLIVPSQAQMPTVTIKLLVGWNMISIPVDPTNDNINNVLSAISGKYQVVYDYDAASGKYRGYVPGAASNELTKLRSGSGYWIYMNDAATLTVRGTATSKGIELKMGWNLVGYNSTKEMSPAEALSSINGKFSSLYNFDTAGNAYIGYVPPTITNLKILKPGMGFWLYATTNTTWTIKPAVPPVPFSAVQKIFTSKCLNCHKGSEAEQGLELTAGDSYKLLVDVDARQLRTMKRVKPFDSSQSYLYHKVNGTHEDVGGGGERMPRKEAPLSDAEIATIKNWIDGGAKPD
jgi:hypothetical protein